MNATRARIMQRHNDAMAADDELAADIQTDIDDALWDFDPEGEQLFAGKGGGKIGRIQKRLGKLRARLEKVENKPEPSGLFARLRSNLRERRIGRLEKRIGRLEGKLESLGVPLEDDLDLMGQWPAGGYTRPRAHAQIPGYQTIGQSANMSDAALTASLMNPRVSERSKVRIRQVLAQRGVNTGVPSYPGGPYTKIRRGARYTPPGRRAFAIPPAFPMTATAFPAWPQRIPAFRPAMRVSRQATRDQRDRMLFRHPHRRVRAARIVCAPGFRPRGNRGRF